MLDREWAGMRRRGMHSGADGLPVGGTATSGPLRRAALLLFVPLLLPALAGCFSELLPAAGGTGIAFVCAVLEPEEAETVVLQSWVGKDVDVDRSLAITALRTELADLSGRDSSRVSAIERVGPAAPRDGWNDSNVQTWGQQQTFLGRGLVTLRVLWVESLGDGNQTGSSPTPGTVALAQAAINAGADHLDTSPAVVARAALLHYAGHALGVVNRGIPVQDPDIQEREGPPNHDPDPTSVLHVGWDDARTMSWAANATYDRYPDTLRRDWAAATMPGGACI